ncbi:hypothetical protein TNCV_3967181 [Trichonephila clavipes]|nr:hypothetical protein TNCV_3967181 [Trichonephila clavipes]
MLAFARVANWRSNARSRFNCGERVSPTVGAPQSLQPSITLTNWTNIFPYHKRQRKERAFFSDLRAEPRPPKSSTCRLRYRDDLIPCSTPTPYSKQCLSTVNFLERRTATAGSDVVQSGRPIFDDFFQRLWPYIGNNTANVVFQMVKRLWLIRIDQ